MNSTATILKSTSTESAYVVAKPGAMAEPYLDGRRIRVRDVAIMRDVLHHAPADINVLDYPSLTRGQIDAALVYYDDHPDEFIQFAKEEQRCVEAFRRSFPSMVLDHIPTTSLKEPIWRCQADANVPKSILQELANQGVDVVMDEGRDWLRDNLTPLLVTTLLMRQVLLTCDSAVPDVVSLAIRSGQTTPPIVFWPQGCDRISDLITKTRQVVRGLRYEQLCDHVILV